MFLTEIANLLSYCRTLLVSLKLDILDLHLLGNENMCINILFLAWLGGQAKTLMFIHIAPEPDAIGESISTLKFAERVATVELGAAKTNKEGGEVKELKEQVNLVNSLFFVIVVMILNVTHFQLLLMFLLLQIACLKAAFASKDGENENIRSSHSSPDILRDIKIGHTSPASGYPMEEVGCVEVFICQPEIYNTTFF
jgi:kinesin family protein C2/C3